jgi:hypothetical protein
MIVILIQTLFLGVSIWAYQTGDSPTYAMFCAGWCSAFLFASVASAVAKELLP